jgi:hypothetical protein
VEQEEGEGDVGAEDGGSLLLQLFPLLWQYGSLPRSSSSRTCSSISIPAALDGQNSGLLNGSVTGDGLLEYLVEDEDDELEDKERLE